MRHNARPLGVLAGRCSPASHNCPLARTSVHGAALLLAVMLPEALGVHMGWVLPGEPSQGFPLKMGCWEGVGEGMWFEVGLGAGWLRVVEGWGLCALQTCSPTTNPAR